MVGIKHVLAMPFKQRGLWPRLAARAATRRRVVGHPPPSESDMADYTPRLLLDNLVFSEGPRWHQGRLWFSDMHAHEVVAVDLGGKRETMR